MKALIVPQRAEPVQRLVRLRLAARRPTSIAMSVVTHGPIVPRPAGSGSTAVAVGGGVGTTPGPPGAAGAAGAAG
jgi:hypothetical protein